MFIPIEARKTPPGRGFNTLTMGPQMEQVIAIAADTLANSQNRKGLTVEQLVAQWQQRIEWLGLKVGGKAWTRELLSVARSGWIATTQKTSTFIPPSEETLAWGGFLGGEFVTTPEMTANAEAAFAARFGGTR